MIGFAILLALGIGAFSIAQIDGLSAAVVTPEPGTSLSEVAAKAANGDTIQLRPGRYTGPVVADGKRLSVQGPAEGGVATIAPGRSNVIAGAQNGGQLSLSNVSFEITPAAPFALFVKGGEATCDVCAIEGTGNTPVYVEAGALGLRHVKIKAGEGDAVVAIGALGMLGLLLAARDGTLVGVHVGPVLLLPFAIAVGVRFGPPAAVVTVSAIAVFILTLTTQGRNPFGREAPADAVIHAQEFIFVLSVMTLGLAALTSRVRASQAELERANDELRRRAEALFDSNRELQLAKGQVVALNDALEQRVRDRTRELREALTQVKELRGLLPICAWCKRVRDDHDYWHSVEEYITERTDAQFSHGICPDCLREVEPRPRS